MKITGNYSLDTSPERIWPLIFEPGALLQMLPGCEKIEQVAPDEYRGRIVLRVPAMSGAYDTHVKVLEYREPSFCRLQGDAFGPTGSVRGQASFTLTPAGAGTRIDYQGEAQITGPLA